MLLSSLTLNYIKSTTARKTRRVYMCLRVVKCQKKHGEIFENINFTLKYDTNKVYNPSKNISFVSYIIPTVKLGSRVKHSRSEFNGLQHNVLVQLIYIFLQSSMNLTNFLQICTKCDSLDY